MRLQLPCLLSKLALLGVHPTPVVPPTAAARTGKFYTLTTGANEKRWGKMKDKLNTTIRSFSLVNA